MSHHLFRLPCVNTLRQRQNGRHFADYIFKCIFLNENFWIFNGISLKYVPWGLIDHMAVLVQIMAWHRRGGQPLSEPMMIILLPHILPASVSRVRQRVLPRCQETSEVVWCPGHRTAPWQQEQGQLAEHCPQNYSQGRGNELVFCQIIQILAIRKQVPRVHHLI